MKFLEDFHYIEPENNGSVFHHEGLILAALARALGGPVLEIGRNRGISTCYILSGTTHPVVSVDTIPRPWEGPPFPNHTDVICPSANFDPAPWAPFEWAYIDGDHTTPGVLTDIEVAKRAGAGLLVFHDTRLPEVDAALEQSGLDVLNLSTHCGIGIARCR